MTGPSEPQRHLIGTILIEQGVLTESQVKDVLAKQADSEQPFGTLATEMFGVKEEQILAALTEQMGRRSPDTDLGYEAFDDRYIPMLTPQQAWDNLILPLRMESGELICATTMETLGGAIRLLQHKLHIPFRFVIAEIRPLEQFIAEKYAYEGVPITDEQAA